MPRSKRPTTSSKQVALRKPQPQHRRVEAQRTVSTTTYSEHTTTTSTSSKGSRSTKTSITKTYTERHHYSQHAPHHLQGPSSNSKEVAKTQQPETIELDDSSDDDVRPLSQTHTVSKSKQETSTVESAGVKKTTTKKIASSYQETRTQPGSCSARVNPKQIQVIELSDDTDQEDQPTANVNTPASDKLKGTTQTEKPNGGLNWVRKRKSTPRRSKSRSTSEARHMKRARTSHMDTSQAVEVEQPVVQEPDEPASVFASQREQDKEEVVITAIDSDDDNGDQQQQPQQYGHTGLSSLPTDDHNAAPIGQYETQPVEVVENGVLDAPIQFNDDVVEATPNGTRDSGTNFGDKGVEATENDNLDAPTYSVHDNVEATEDTTRNASMHSNKNDVEATPDGIGSFPTDAQLMQSFAQDEDHLEDSIQWHECHEGLDDHYQNHGALHHLHQAQDTDSDVNGINGENNAHIQAQNDSVVDRAIESPMKAYSAIPEADMARNKRLEDTDHTDGHVREIFDGEKGVANYSRGEQSDDRINKANDFTVNNYAAFPDVDVRSDKRQEATNDTAADASDTLDGCNGSHKILGQINEEHEEPQREELAAENTCRGPKVPAAGEGHNPTISNEILKTSEEREAEELLVQQNDVSDVLTADLTADQDQKQAAHGNDFHSEYTIDSGPYMEEVMAFSDQEEAEPALPIDEMIQNNSAVSTSAYANPSATLLPQQMFTAPPISSFPFAQVSHQNDQRNPENGVEVCFSQEMFTAPLAASFSFAQVDLLEQNDSSTVEETIHVNQFLTTEHVRPSESAQQAERVHMGAEMLEG